MKKRDKLRKLTDKARHVSEELRETTASKKVRDVANSTKIRDAAASVKGPVQDASKKASDLGIATAERLKFGSRKSLDATAQPPTSSSRPLRRSWPTTCPVK